MRSARELCCKQWAEAAFIETEQIFQLLNETVSLMTTMLSIYSLNVSDEEIAVLQKKLARTSRLIRDLHETRISFADAAYKEKQNELG